MSFSVRIIHCHLPPLLFHLRYVAISGAASRAREARCYVIFPFVSAFYFWREIFTSGECAFVWSPSAFTGIFFLLFMKGLVFVSLFYAV